MFYLIASSNINTIPYTALSLICCFIYFLIIYIQKDIIFNFLEMCKFRIGHEFETMTLSWPIKSILFVNFHLQFYLN